MWLFQNDFGKDLLKSLCVYSFLFVTFDMRESWSTTSCAYYRLTEIGPRMTLQLIKIEEGVCSGEILYHEYIIKSPEEVKAAKEMRQQKK